MDKQPAGNSNQESPFAATRLPQLSILHFMLWMSCVAIHLAANRAILALQKSLPPEVVSVQRMSNVVQGVVAGAILAGAIILVHTRVRGNPPMLRHPGHWLLLIGAIIALMYYPLLGLLLLLDRMAFNDVSFVWAYGLIYLLTSILYIVAMQHSNVFGWKVFFDALAVLGVLQSLFYLVISLGLSVAWIGILSAVFNWGGFFASGLLVFVAILDLAAHRRRDWLHWTGVATYLAGNVVSVVWMIGPWFA